MEKESTPETAAENRARLLRVARENLNVSFLFIYKEILFKQRFFLASQESAGKFFRDKIRHFN